jgi:hypothetical protein
MGALDAGLSPQNRAAALPTDTLAGMAMRVTPTLRYLERFFRLR